MLKLRSETAFVDFEASIILSYESNINKSKIDGLGDWALLFSQGAYAKTNFLYIRPSTIPTLIPQHTHVL